MDMRGTSPADAAFARFFRSLSAAALDLAQELEAGQWGEPGALSLDDANLGSLQRKVANVLEMMNEEGVSPRQIAQHLDRGDEPSIRTALGAMQKRGVAELIPAVSPQRWRLTLAYRKPQ
ncbi:MAG: hypothetical protein ACRDNF_15005 [Streptosporangiaceae bacterium]